MKKMSFVFLIPLLLTACEILPKEDLELNNQLLSYEIGKTHNEILMYIYNKQKTGFTSTENISMIEQFLTSVKMYDEQKIKECVQDLTATPEFDLMFNAKSAAEDLNIYSYLEAVKKHFNPSIEIMNCIKKAFNLGEFCDPKEVKDYVINNIQKKAWTGNDKELAHVFTDVFLHSYDYWMSTRPDTKALKRSSLVILYDAGGAIHGLIFGPIGSIIEGALLSVAANERLPE